MQVGTRMAGREMGGLANDGINKERLAKAIVGNWDG